MRRKTMIGLGIAAAVACAALAAPGTFALWSGSAPVTAVTIASGVTALKVDGDADDVATLTASDLKRITPGSTTTFTIGVEGEQEGDRGLYYTLAPVTGDAGLMDAVQAVIRRTAAASDCADTSQGTPLYSGTLADTTIAKTKIVDSVASDTQHGQYLCVDLSLPTGYGAYENTGTVTATGVGSSLSDGSAGDSTSTSTSVSAQDSWYGQAVAPEAAYDQGVSFAFAGHSVRPGAWPAGLS